MPPEVRRQGGQRRLIEAAFPLRQASLDSVHEKNVRHGHISTLHIWPARRPLAACRAALVATLLPDPETDEERERILEKLGGTVVTKIESKRVGGRTVEVEREETVGGVLHWGRESSPDMEWFRQEIRTAYGGRAPRVLDPFAGGGAIPLEAMRLGCETLAADINPVAWLILKCTLEYPQKLGKQHLPLPRFALESPEFMEGFFRGTTKLTKKQLERNLRVVQARLFPPPAVDLAWHVRSWGWWIFQQTRQDLAGFYPTYAEFEPPRDAATWRTRHSDQLRSPALVPTDASGRLNVASMNAEFSQEYLDSLQNPRWVAKPTVAYLWARTVACKNCRAVVPLLKTRWLCKKDNKRVLLMMEPNPSRTGVVFGVQSDVPTSGGNSAQRRENDKRLGQGTMSRAGAWCPCCGRPGTVAMEMEDVRQEGLARRLGLTPTAVIVEGEHGKEYRLPTSEEVTAASDVAAPLEEMFAHIPFGKPDEPTPTQSQFSGVANYGMLKWSDIFTPRQLLSIATIARHTRSVTAQMREDGYQAEWIEAVTALLYCALGRLADRNSELCTWQVGAEKIGHTFTRFALPITWDFVEVMPWADSSGGYGQATEWVARAIEHACIATRTAPNPNILRTSAISSHSGVVDLVLTDPPYYDAIPYSDLMDFFYVWLRRCLCGLSDEIDQATSSPLSPKWNNETGDGELIDDASRHDWNRARSKAVYEDGMYRSFKSCHEALRAEGRMVVVFAHKHPDAWETLVSAIIRAGFLVDGSWPIQTERTARTRSISSAALSSSVWLVCGKRSEDARPGWDNVVLDEMRANIYGRLRQYWDAGIRGPDFVWAATGPALEAFSKHPVVKKANDPGKTMEVSEFLRAVRRIVVDFVVGRVLTRDTEQATATGLDDVTTYYLLHRHDFGSEDAPIGPCILYSVSCGLSDRDLIDRYDILIRTGGKEAEEDVEISEDDQPEEGSGSKVRLKTWSQRVRRGMGVDTEGRLSPLIDQVHHLMHLWKAGDQVRVDEYLEAMSLRRNALFHQLLQALIELSAHGSDERSLLEILSNHIAARGPEVDRGSTLLSFSRASEDDL